MNHRKQKERLKLIELIDSLSQKGQKNNSSVELPLLPKREKLEAVIGQCGKHLYTTQSKAKAAVRYRLNKGADTSKLFTYYCEQCNAWHMTSKPQK
jgi:hypothetical protein